MLEQIKYLLDALPGMKLCRIAYKEINLIKTQRIALLLILLYPLLIIGILGMAFGTTSILRGVDIVVYIPQDVRGHDSVGLINQLESTGKLTVHRLGSEEEVVQAIESRAARIGLIIHEPESQFGRLVIDVRYDDSQLLASQLLYEVVSNSLRSVAFEKSRGVLSEIWGELNTIKTRLSGEIERVDSFVEQLDQSELKIIDLNESVNDIDISDINSMLRRQSARSGETEGIINNFSSRLRRFESSLIKIRAEINETRDKLVYYRSECDSQRELLRGYDSSLVEIETELEEAHSEIGRTFPEIDDALVEIGNARTEIAHAVEQIEKVKQDIDETIAELDEMDGEIDRLEKELEESSRSMDDVRSMLGDTYKDINFMNAELSGLSETVSQVRLLIDDALDSKKSVDANLTESKGLMLSFIDSLEGLQKLHPEFLASPFIVNKIGLFALSKLALLTPLVIALVIMLTSMLLTGVSFIAEKREGAYFRMRLSPTTRLSLFAGKVLGQLIFAVVESLLILFIAALFFGLTIKGSIISILIVLSLVAFAFIALGLLITNFTSQHSTTILSSLLIMVPMIFLSGMVLPIEIMNPLLQGIASVLPLSVSSVLLLEVIVKGTSILNMIPEILLLAVPSLLFVAFTILKEQK